MNVNPAPAEENKPVGLSLHSSVPFESMNTQKSPKNLKVQKTQIPVSSADTSDETAFCWFKNRTYFKVSIIIVSIIIILTIVLAVAISASSSDPTIEDSSAATIGSGIFYHKIEGLSKMDVDIWTQPLSLKVTYS